MIFIPKERPIANNLNSYYIKIDKLFEHYQGELKSGGVYFQSLSSEGAIFFDDNDLIGGLYQDKDKFIDGREAIKWLLSDVSKNNYSISIYEIGLDAVYYWSNLSNAKVVYNDLSSEFTDLEGLIKKMNVERLIGYIEIILARGKAGTGIIFFNNGEIIGSSFSINKGELKDSKSTQEFLIKKARELGGVFNVKKVSIKKEKEHDSEDIIKAKPTLAASKNKPVDTLSPALEMVAQLLTIFEKCVKKNKGDFDTLLKRKFMEKADKYDFLDPFAAEFRYSNGKVKLSIPVEPAFLLKGVWESITELTNDLKISKNLNDDLTPWKQKYVNEVAKFGIKE
ncbi:MAG: hypothetical protein HQK79_14280 [Desulfobacterales bacterium]|nr:hypothetical protein [Desulfobacterales bacterium]MBF0396334.1 hypothetical protein [Desulfobacterales bacterium]